MLTAALTNRLHEVSLLLDAGSQMNAVLELDELLDTILRNACELLDATGGSVMLVQDTDLVTKAVLGRVLPPGHRVRLGDGVAGHVALRRDARVAGLREFQTPSLEAVERRRRQLWQRTATGLAAVAFVVVVLSVIPDQEAALFGAGRAQVGVLVIA